MGDQGLTDGDQELTDGDQELTDGTPMVDRWGTKSLQMGTRPRGYKS